MDYFPLPPPWRRTIEGDTIYYINDVTHERHFDHPLKGREADILDRNNNSRSFSLPTAAEREDVETLTETEHKHDNALAPFVPSSSNLQFRCEWKETGLFGDRHCFGLTLLYDNNDQNILLKFDGIDNASWQYSVLEGPHGPVDRYDLFIGSRVKLLGRSLTICSASSTATKWIDREYKKLLKQQEFLISKVESVGTKPVVRRQTVVSMVNIERDFKGTGGRCDLRKALNENKRLSEQLAGLGLGHFVSASKNLR